MSKPSSCMLRLAPTATLVAACAGEGDHAEVMNVTDRSIAEVASFEQYRDRSVVEVEGHRFFNVEWDLYYSSEEALRAHYEEITQGSREKAVVIRQLSTNADVVWERNGSVLDMRYCVSNSFSDHTQVLADIQAATREWAAVANVRFVYEPAADANCTNTGNALVDFTVFPASIFGACGTPPFLPSAALSVWCPYALGTLAINYDYFESVGESTVGVFRHELGHLLGLRHEHPWAPSPVCGEGQSYPTGDIGGRQLTAYDQQSVMHYPQCGGMDLDFALSALDGVGMRSLYGMPAAWYVPTI